MRLFLCLLMAVSAQAASTTYYIDMSRTVDGTGTSNSPWKNLHAVSTGGPDWAQISNSLATGPVTILMSSRGVESDGVGMNIQATSSNWLSVVGDKWYNTNQTGTAIWYPEAGSSNRATINSAGISIPKSWTGISNIVVQGIMVTSNAPAFDFSLSDCCASSPPFTGCCSTNVHGIHMTNCAAMWIAGPGGYLMFAGNNTTNCYDYVLSGCVVSNCTQGAMYSCRYSYIPDTVTNWVIESNIFWNACRAIGGSPAGDSGVINIKPGTYGAIVQYNLVGRDPGLGGCGNGVFGCADGMVIRGNTFQNCGRCIDTSYGSAIFVTTGGDAQGTPKTITSCYIYDNLIVGNTNIGIKLDCSTVGATMSGVRIWNNTIVSNVVGGILLGSVSGASNNVTAIENNLLQNNGAAGQELAVGAQASVATLDYNIYYRSDGASQNNVNTVNKTWAQWQALGYDVHGLTNDPTLNADYSIPTGSPAKDAGTTIGSFNTDILFTHRPQGPAWDIGAFEFIYPTPPSFWAGSIRAGRVSKP